MKLGRSLFCAILPAFILFPTLTHSATAAKVAVVRIEDVTPDRVKTRLKWIQAWFLANLSSEGAMTYRVELKPSFYKSDSNNMIRQWMGTLALFRLGKFLKNPVLLKAAEKNLAYNRDHYLWIEENKKIAYIYGEGSVKLGAAGFALMSFIEAQQDPQREKWISYLKNFILSQQKADGSFQTFYYPPRNDNQNFYPGEAAVALMTLYSASPEKELASLEAVERAWPFYRDYFRKQPNPAFVPWWTQALFKLYQVKPQKEIADFVFEMNDFLISLQNTPQSLKTAQPETLGRFFDPAKPFYGPPHASSTAVYTEGLIDALQLARSIQDAKRIQNYEYAVRWGLRSLFQLQYTETEAQNPKSSKKFFGGIRSSEDSGEIRVDNTQHSAMAMINLFSDKKVWPEVLGD